MAEKTNKRKSTKSSGGSKRNYNRVNRVARKTVENAVRKKPILAITLALIILIVGVVGYFICIKKGETPKPPSAIVPVNGELSIHVMTLGNNHSGDCIYIKAGDKDILVDAGSETSSLNSIKEYLNTYVTDGILEFVIVTHADSDHIANFAGTTKEYTSVFDYYKCEKIIDFALTDKTTQTYNRYIEKRNKEVEEDGAVHYTALECWNNSGSAKRVYDLSEGITLNILYNYYYEHKSSDENNYSVCFQIIHGDRKFLFTGDLEKDGEEKIVTYHENNLGEVEFYKAGHHGSKTSSNECLLKVIKPKICVVPCAAGSVQYLTSGAQNLHNTFPTQDFIDRISVYTDKVYVPTYADIELGSNGRWKDTGTFANLNGNIIVISEKDGVRVNCSENDTLLKDTTWFSQNRDMPTYWA